MDINELMGIGFTKNESIVYLSAIKFGEADASMLIKDTKLHKKLVYENLERLIDKGLVSFVIEEGRKIFKINPANMLVEYFNEKINHANLLKENAIRIAKEINLAKKQVKHRQNATVYRGIKGIKTFYTELLDVGEDYVVFGAPHESINILSETFWLNLNQKLAARKIRCRLIFNKSIKLYGERIKSKLIDIKYFSGDFEPLTETNIQKDRVAIIVWTEVPILFLIEDKFAAESYRKYFEDMWKKAKK